MPTPAPAQTTPSAAATAAPQAARPGLSPAELAALREQVAATERTFAASMARRDLAAFTALLAEEAVFIDRSGVLRGQAAVAAGWAPLFEGPTAPFSWEPDQVEVLADGSLAHSSGPVRNAAGQPIARFNSIWRQQAPGVWRIVFDKGQPWTPPPEPAAPTPVPPPARP